MKFFARITFVTALVATSANLCPAQEPELQQIVTRGFDYLREKGGPRSYGSMTYSGFKSLVYAGLTKVDPRAKAALKWIGKHYSLTENPGMRNAGLYYYYHTFGAALRASGLPEISDAAGQSREWSTDLIETLGKSQQDDGSWVNSNRQWFENDPNLCTAFALMALSYCDEAAPEK